MLGTWQSILASIGRNSGSGVCTNYMIREHSARSYETRSRGRAIIVELNGEIGQDVPSAADLAREAHEKRTQVAILDLTKAETINSKGLEWLEQVSTTLEPAGVKVRVVTKEGSKVWRILKLMRFDRFILILASVFDAITFGRRRRSKNQTTL